MPLDKNDARALSHALITLSSYQDMKGVAFSRYDNKEEHIIIFCASGDLYHEVRDLAEQILQKHGILLGGVIPAPNGEAASDGR